MASASEMKGRLQDYLDNIRESLEELDEDKADSVKGTTADFFEPCQLELFWVKSPLEHQLLVKTNDDNREDREIIINGPYETYDFIDGIKEVLAKPRWQQPIEEDRDFLFPIFEEEPNGVLKRSDRMADLIKGLVDYAETNIFKENESNLQGSTVLAGSSVCYWIQGDIAETPFLEFVEGQIERQSSEDSTSGEKYEEQSQEEAEGSDLNFDSNGFGTYFYEPIWVDGKPERSFEEKVLDSQSSDYDSILREQVGGNEVVVQRDGFIAIKNADREESLNLLNSIFGASLFLDHSFQASTHQDLVPVKIGEGKILTKRGKPSVQRLIASPDYTPEMSFPIPFFGNVPMIERKIISSGTLSQNLDIGENIYDNEDLREKVNFALQAYTHHANGEYSQSYLLSWIAIEQHINQLLNGHLRDEVNVNSNRRGKITDSPNWTSTHKIEILEISDAIDEEEYNKIDKMRKKRNKIVHEMDTADESESENILNFTLSMLYEDVPDGEDDQYVFKI